MATAAAAAVARARREIRHQFFAADAVRPDRAIAFAPDRMIERRQFERMVRKGIIHEGNPGSYWLDVVAYDVELSARFKRVKIVLAVVILVLMVALLIPLLRS